MKNPLILATAALILALPFMGSVKADAGGFRPIMATGAWNYGSYRVEKLAFSDAAVGPFTLGNSVFVAEPEGGCASSCELYTLNLIKDGSVKGIPHVPAKAFSKDRFHANDGRLVFARRADLDGDRYDVIEVDLETGSETTLADDVFAKNAVKVGVAQEWSGPIFLEFEYEPVNKNKAYRQQAVFVYDEQEGVANIVSPHSKLRHEEIQDVYRGVALVKMAFETGHEELWLMDPHDVGGLAGKSKAIPGTWTDPGADIVAAHFRNDGSVEFFKNFVRHTYKPGADNVVSYPADTITWFRDLKTAYEFDGEQTVWVDAEDRLHVASLSYGSRVIGKAAFGRFYPSDYGIYFATEQGGKNSAMSGDLPLAVLDVNGNREVGVSGLDQIVYHNRSTGIFYDIGKGYSPVVDADGRAYWHGTKSGIYSATFVPGAVKSASARDAAGHFVRGTRVKFEGKAAVFVVGGDRRLHLIPSETVAFQLYGSDWNKGIVTVKENEMFDYPLGGLLQTSRDLDRI